MATNDEKPEVMEEEVAEKTSASKVSESPADSTTEISEKTPSSTESSAPVVAAESTEKSVKDNGKAVDSEATSGKQEGSSKKGNIGLEPGMCLIKPE